MKLFSAFFTVILALIVMIPTVQADGFGIDATRLIYHEGVPSIVTIVRNTTHDTPYLINASVVNSGKDKKSKLFIVLPPLFRLEPGSTNQIRITMLNGKLPHDKESLFYFTANAIPASKKPSVTNFTDQTSGMVQFGIGNVIKLFYRPAGLKSSSEDAQKGLHFKSVISGVEVSNPSPYYVSFTGIKINNVPLSLKKIDDLMLMPFSHHLYLTSQHKGTVEWKVINDSGGVNIYSQQIH